MADRFTFRKAKEADLPHMKALSETAGGKIVPGGGDFVVNAWQNSWWKQHPELHFNQWIFDGGRPVAFVRIECYGPPGRPESGWLEGLRVDPAYQGQGLMSRVVEACIEQLPENVRGHIYLAVGSTNEQMVAISDRKYAFLSGWIFHGYDPAAAKPPPEVEEAAAAVTVRQLDSDDIGAAWALAVSDLLYRDGGARDGGPRDGGPRAGDLLCPGRFYGFRAFTRSALDEKIRTGRAHGAYEGVPDCIHTCIHTDAVIYRCTHACIHSMHRANEAVPYQRMAACVGALSTHGRMRRWSPLCAAPRMHPYMPISTYRCIHA